MRSHFIAALAIAAVPTLARAQFDPVPNCEPGASSTGLRQALAKGTVPSLSDDGHGSYDAWSTSMLATGGADPSKRLKREEGEEPEEFEYRVNTARAAWTCRYSAQRATDGDPKTAWVEGVAEAGIGEIVVAKVDSTRAVEIWAGLGASPALHAANARPRKVKVSVLRSTRVLAGQYGMTYQDARVLASHEVELRDVNGYQPLALPAHVLPKDKDPDGPPNATFVAIEILSVYLGTKYADTCISEVRSAPAK